MILLAALWILSLLSLLSLSAGREVRLDLRLTGHANRAILRDALYDAWLARAERALLADPDWAVDTPRDPWRNDPLLADGPAPSETRLVALGASGDWQPAAGLTDEEAKLPLAALLAPGARAPHDAGPFVAWVAAEGKARHLGPLPGGYVALPRALELWRKEVGPGGRTPGDPLAWLGYLTGTSSGAVNLHTAPATVLAALGLDGPLVGKLVAYRESGRTFRSADTVLEDLAAFAPLTQEELRALQRLHRAGLLAVGSRHFSFIAEVRLPGERLPAYRRYVLRRTPPDHLEVVEVVPLHLAHRPEEG